MAAPALAVPLPLWRQPSFIVVCACLVALVGFGVRSTFGFFTAPMSEAHGWGREVYGFAMALQNLLWGVAQPIAGAFADRYGSGRVLMAGAVIYAAGVVLMALADTPFELHLTGGILVGIGIATASFSIVMAALARMVPEERRSWAFGIATAASSLGQFLFAPLGQAFISAYGWQTALYLLAACVLSMLAFALPLNAQQVSNAPQRPEPEIPLRAAIQRAFGHQSYVLLVFGFFVCGFHIAFITIHLPAYLVEKGVSTWAAAAAISLVGLFNVIGSYGSGMLGAKYPKRHLLSMLYLLRAIFIAVFIAVPVSTASAMVFAAAMGLLWLSTVPLTMGLVTVMFGMRYMATLYGFVFLSHQVGSFLGVWLGGRVYDLYGNYDPIWWASIALGVFAALVHYPIRERRAATFAQPAAA